MKPSELRQGIRARIRELQEQVRWMEHEISTLKIALDGLGGGSVARAEQGGTKSRSREFRGRQSMQKRGEAMERIMAENPTHEFSPRDPLFHREGIPGSTADTLLRRWVVEEKVEQVGSTPRGAPIVKLKPVQLPTPMRSQKETIARKPGAATGITQPEPDTGSGPPQPEVRSASAEEKRRQERMEIVNLLSSHPDGLMQRQIADRIGVDQPRLSMLLKGMGGTVSITAEKREIKGVNRSVKIVRLMRRGVGPREAVTTPGDGTREGRLR